MRPTITAIGTTQVFDPAPDVNAEWQRQRCAEAALPYAETPGGPPVAKRQGKRPPLGWSKKSRLHHLDLVNEFAQLAVLGRVQPARSYSLTLKMAARPPGVKPHPYARQGKREFERAREWITRHGGLILAVVQPLPSCPETPHLEAFVTVLEGSLEEFEAGLRAYWRQKHPGRDRCVLKRLATAADVKRVLLYPHHPKKLNVPDRLGNIRDRVMTGGLHRVERLVPMFYGESDALLALAHYLQMCERRKRTSVDWRRLKFYSSVKLIGQGKLLDEARQEAWDYLLERWKHLLFFGTNSRMVRDAWRILDVTLRPCENGELKIVPLIYAGEAEIDVDALPSRRRGAGPRGDK